MVGKKNPASALGEAVGKLIEDVVRSVLEELVRELGGKILESKNKKLKDKAGIEYEIDFPVEKNGKLLALVDVKYLKYKKHARDKGSWVVVAHNRLRATYPSIKRCIVILTGTGWSKPAIKMIKTACIDVIHIPPGALMGIFEKHGIKITWNEKDVITPRKSWEKWNSLTEEEKKIIKNEIIEKLDLKEKLRKLLSSSLKNIEENNKSSDLNKNSMKLNYMCNFKRKHVHH